MSIKNLTPIPFQHVRLNDGFWTQWQRIVHENTAAVCLDRCEETHRIDNFKRAAGSQPGGFEGRYYNDSDVHKVVEGLAYLLHTQDDPALRERADAVVSAICSAQQPDGYLNSYFILTGLDQRWQDMGMHEAYCLGHMVEAAVAYDQATGDDRLLTAAKRAIDQMRSEIGPGKKHWVTGHQELELALIRLYRHTGDRSYLEYAAWLIDERGHGHLRSEHLYQHFGDDTGYCQDDVPARDLDRVTGHAVRAMYYYAAMADFVALTGDEAMRAALDRLWNHVVPKNLYVTGGIGQSRYNEGFTRDWHLPNLTAYCETCAAIGMALWNQRMNQIEGDAKYADIVELEMYNGILSGLDLSGKTFFYDNPLASAGAHRRSGWFECSCCPTNLIRFIPSIGNYLFAVDGESIFVNQYTAAEAAFDIENGPARLRMDTAYPWEGDIRIAVEACPEGMSLRLRIPGWCDGWTLSVNGAALSPIPANGYVAVCVAAGDKVLLSLQMPVRRIHGYPEVMETKGRVAFARGPLVYCVEEIDQPGIPSEYFAADLRVPTDAETSAEPFSTELNGIRRLRVGQLSLIPYYAWSNRGRGGMTVWIREEG